MTLDETARAELERLEATGRRRAARQLESAQGPRITLDGVEVLNFAANDYLGLAGDQRLVQAAVETAGQVGIGAGASRLIVGNHQRHRALELTIAEWMRRDGVRLFGSGYAANVGVLTTILGAEDVVFSDELNHASIIDGCRLSRARIEVFAHRDLRDLERGLERCAGRRRVVVSETLFSMDGDIVDASGLAALCRQYDAALVLDEAHALGVFGPEGRGIAAEVGVVPDVLVGTGGKALGCFGAFAVTTKAIAEWLWNGARPLVFSTAMPMMLCGALTAAIDIVRSVEGDELRRQAHARARQLRELVHQVGGDARSPIAPLLVGDDRRAMAMTGALLREGVFAQGIRPPTVPEGTARLRVSLSAKHTAQDVEILGRLLLRCST